MSWFKLLQWGILIGLLVFAAINLYPHFSDFSKLRLLKDQINYFWVLCALGCQIGEYIADAWLSQTLLRVVSVRISLRHTFLVASLDVFAAHLLPIGDLGGLAAAYHFYRKMGVSAEQFFFMSLSWGVLTHTVLFFFFVFSLIFMPSLPFAIHTTTIGLAIIGIVLIIIGLTIWQHNFVLTQASHFLSRYSWSKDLASFIANRKTYLALIRSHKNLLSQAILAATLYYLCDVATLLFAFFTFHTFPAISIIIFAYTVALLLGRIGLTPAGLGTAEAVLLLFFIKAGIDSPVAVAAVLVFRLMSFWLCIPAGFFAYLALKRELSRDSGLL